MQFTSIIAIAASLFAGNAVARTCCCVVTGGAPFTYYGVDDALACWQYCTPKYVGGATGIC